MAPEPIKIKGITQLQHDLKAISNDAAKELRVVFNQAATLVVKRAQGNVPRVTGAARASIKAHSGQYAAKVVAGSTAVPYFGWLDFGGRIKHKHSVSSRTFHKDGRYVYPAYYAQKADLQTLLVKSLDQLAKSHGLVVK